MVLSPGHVLFTETWFYFNAVSVHYQMFRYTHMYKVGLFPCVMRNWYTPAAIGMFVVI